MKLPQTVAGVFVSFAFTGILWAQAPIVREPPQQDQTVPLPAYAPPPVDATEPNTIPLPSGVGAALAELTSQPATHTSFTLDRSMLQGILGKQAAQLNAVMVTNYRFREPAFYVPEALAAMRAGFDAAGWKHLVDAHASPRDQASPVKPITDLWLHYRGTEIDDVAVLVRAPKQMDLIEVSGTLRPLDFIHLGGHFGIPKIDPGAVMVAAPPGR